MKAQLCPKCNGQGIVSKPSWIAGDVDTWSGSGTATYICDLCNGGKVIYIPDKGCYPAYCPEKYMGEI